MKALLTVTLNPAGFLGALASSGGIGKGKIADLVLLDADPLADISNTQRIAAMVLGGNLLSKESLQKNWLMSRLPVRNDRKQEYLFDLSMGGNSQKERYCEPQRFFETKCGYRARGVVDESRRIQPK